MFKYSPTIQVEYSQFKRTLEDKMTCACGSQIVVQLKYGSSIRIRYNSGFHVHNLATIITQIFFKLQTMQP